VENMSANANTINQTNYRRLLSKAMPMVIESEKENDRMLAFVEKLMEKGEDISPEEGKLLSLLATLIQDFEKKFYKPKDVSPIEMLHHLMDARGLKQNDLWSVFGSKGITSEVINEKRGLSKTHIKKLAAFFSVSPELFI
jgi:HTH-type transcriptional regulator/antitoxin HigA